jgi:VanZ family protein
MTLSRAWTAPLIWAAIIATVTSIPASAIPSTAGFPHQDKLIHGALYAILALLSARAVGLKRGDVGWAAGLALLVGLAAFAAIDEWHQRVVPGRSPSVADWTADLGGAAVGLTTFAVARLRRESRTT